MKKIVSLILCVSLLFSLSACAELDAIRNTELPPLPTPEVKATEAPAPAEEEAAPEESRETPVPEIAVAEGDATGAEIGDRVIIYTKKTSEDLDAPDGSPILIFSYVTPTVRIDERPEAAKAINEQLVLFDEAYITGSGSDSGKNNLLQEALDNYSYVHYTGAELNTTFTSARTVKSLRADGSVVSFRYWTSVYTGGKGGSQSYCGANYSTQTGEKLTLDMLSSDAETLKTALGDRIISVARENADLYAEISKNDVDADSALRALVREGNWYFSDAVYYRNAKRILKNTTVNKRKWNLVLSPNSYVMYGDAPLTVANLVTMEGHYSLNPDGNLTFYEESDGGETITKKAHICKLTDKELVYCYEKDQFPNLNYMNEQKKTAVADKVYYSFFRL